MEITKVVKTFIRRGANTFGNIVYFTMPHGILFLFLNKKPVSSLSCIFVPFSEFNVPFLLFGRKTLNALLNELCSYPGLICLSVHSMIY